MTISRKVKIQEKLAATRDELMDTLKGLDAEQWNTRVYSEEASWTVLDLLRHLSDSEGGMIGTMQSILDGHGGVPEDFDLARWNARAVEKAKELSAYELFEKLARSRPKLMAFLEPLTEEELDLRGRHASLRIMSIEEICHLIADHEQLHLQHIKKAIAA